MRIRLSAEATSSSDKILGACPKAEPMAVAPETHAISYVLPIKCSAGDDLRDLDEYLKWLGARTQTIVVDGSVPELFAHNHRRWRPPIQHLSVAAQYTGLNGKVNGVRTGLLHAVHRNVIIADDDVRYDDAGLGEVARLLRTHDLVRPQNYFDPLPWHARWDTARSLINRAVAATDYPGTLGIRADTFHAMGGYDGDVLFENLELIRTVRACGGTEISPLDLLVRRVPPPVTKFLSQRTRQAYDSWAQPWRMAAELALLPAVFALRRRPGVLAMTAAASVAVSDRGRRLPGGTAFGRTTALYTPLWLAERSVCSWVAALQRLSGGTAYGGGRIAVAAHSQRWLRRRLEQSTTGTAGYRNAVVDHRVPHWLSPPVVAPSTRVPAPATH